MGGPVFDAKRITDEFLELVSVDSESLAERVMADRLTEKLKKLGFEVTEDDAGSKIGGNAGNLFATIRGDIPGKPILLAGHMDTVAPGRSKKPVLHPGGKITSDGTTVLGADDMAAVTEILAGIRAVREAGIPHRDIEILFTVAEEPFGLGSGAFDCSRVKAGSAYVLDATGLVGTVIVKAPTILSFSVKVKGRGAHAGFEPEKGINAIKIASLAIAGIEQGRIDLDTTLNIGLIEGGSVVNAVPAVCRVSGEIRSYDHLKALSAFNEVEAAFRKEAGKLAADIETEYTVKLRAYETPADSETVVQAKRAVSLLGIEPVISKTFGGSDNNNLAANGIQGVVLSCGMYSPHTVREYTTVSDLTEGAKLVANLITGADIQ